MFVARMCAISMSITRMMHEERNVNEVASCCSSKFLFACPCALFCVVSGLCVVLVVVLIGCNKLVFFTILFVNPVCVCSVTVLL